MNKPFERKGFTFGMGVGAGSLSLNTNDTCTTAFTFSVPNLKIGYILNPRLAIQLMLPGATYRYQGKDRGFEAMILGCQYWPVDRCWIQGGVGLTFDAPAFYTVSDADQAKFYSGFPAFTLATGYEIWRRGTCAFDIQYRFFYGKSELDAGVQRSGMSHVILFGVNWY